MQGGKTFRSLTSPLSLCEVPLVVSPDPPGQLEVLGHDGDPPSVDAAQHAVLKEVHQVGLGRLLQRLQGGRLEAEALQRRADANLLGQVLHQPGREGERDWGKCGSADCHVGSAHLENGSRGMRKLVVFWYCRISQRALIPGRRRRFLLSGHLSGRWGPPPRPRPRPLGAGGGGGGVGVLRGVCARPPLPRNAPPRRALFALAAPLACPLPPPPPRPAAAAAAGEFPAALVMNPDEAEDVVEVSPASLDMAEGGSSRGKDRTDRTNTAGVVLLSFVSCHCQEFSAARSL